MFEQGERRDGEELKQWQGRYQRNKAAYEGELARMDRREQLYRGTKEIRGIAGGRAKPATHVRNVIAELVESQVSSTLPQPKVVALRPQDEGLARVIEDMLRNQMDRLPMEYHIDQEERTVPIQGGALSLVEWDNTQRTHGTVGELCVTLLHPKKVIPQDGVFSDVEDMDYIFLDVPQTKRYIKRRYGVNVSNERESDPEVRGVDGDVSAGEDIVTQHFAYYRNEDGGIGSFSWVGDLVLEDLKDYQARLVHTCKECQQRGDGKKCVHCGGKQFKSTAEEWEELAQDITLHDGRVIPAWSDAPDEPGALGTQDGFGLPAQGAVQRMTRIPYYKPDIYPVVLRKNVSLFGKFLGDSDADKIEDQQETIKKLETKVIEKLFKGGSLLTAPENATLDLTDEELRVLRLKDVSQKGMIDVYNLQPNVSGDLSFLSQVYEEARQITGITDSFQGRQDRTATSGVAKQISVQQSAGRLESKKAMKDGAYARLFETMFKFMLAYSDEPRTIVSQDEQGHRKYDTFYRYNFLEQDAAGEWYWNDRFLFSVDASSTLASNREALWQETRMNYQQGCYGQVGELETLVVFWSRMEQIHYPGAADTKGYFEAKRQTQQEMEQQAAAMQPVQGVPMGGVPGMGGAAG